ncbi:uncharacterized protein LOC131672442 isoform X2 [Phymastichus coffea]|uniref:uncharacterized protein LOC131672442 isoform X2 n=1 Tax=Phymastichus coffea TaxID=108790 RepID=UPI00273CD0B4|nr:uncharacterized protein LOC131672442 isoform X2 [Phymastichus coffea]
MAKKESPEQLTSNSIDSKEASVSDASEKTNENFLVPTTILTIKKTLKKSKKNKKTSTFFKMFNDKKRKHGKKTILMEKASDKNIATLLRSERLLEHIKKGSKIPYDIGYHISQKTGFKSVSELNDYISAHRKKFIVLVDRKEKHCQVESSQCNSLLRRTDSVDLNLYLKHHYEDSTDNPTS